MNPFLSKTNILIFFFLLYSLFSYLVSWLLIDFYVSSNISKNTCFELEKNIIFLL